MWTREKPCREMLIATSYKVNVLSRFGILCSHCSESQPLDENQTICILRYIVKSILVKSE